MLVQAHYYPTPIDFAEGDGETCICPLDIEATAAANGFRVVRYEWDSSYYFEPNPGKDGPLMGV